MTDINTAKSGDARVFVQDGGITPAEAYNYFGCLSLDGPSQDEGSSDPVYCPSSTQRNKWEIIDQVAKAQALGSTDFTQHIDRYLRDAWWDIRRRKCFFNLQVVLGSCQAPDDFTKWDSKLLLRNSRLTNLALPALNALSGDDNAILDLTGSLEFRDMVEIRSIKFSEVADSVIVAEALDGLYHDFAQCGDCGPSSDGCQKAYVLTLSNGGSPGLSSQIVHTTNGWSTETSLDIPVLSGLSGSRLAAVGAKLVVVSQAKGGHAYADFDSVDADDTTAWAVVTSGYVAAKGPRAIWSRSASRTFVAAAGGYIYLMTDPTLAVSVLTDGSVTTQQLNDIHGNGNTVVAVGGSNAVVVSTNGGDSFYLVTGPAVGIALNAVWVMSSNVWFVGTANGQLYYTTNGGSSWTQISLPSGITTIEDIHFDDIDVIGYLTVQKGATAQVYRSTDSGHSWQNTAPSVDKLPTAERINFAATCGPNVVMVGGRKTSGGDGVVAVAS
jgi:hypothetical protein